MRAGAVRAIIVATLGTHQETTKGAIAMTDRNDMYAADADAAGKQDETMDADALRDQDLDQAAGGFHALKNGDAAADAFAKNDKPESDAHAR